MRKWLISGSTASQNATVWDAIKAGTPVHVRMIFTDQNITLEDQDISLDSGLVVNDIFNGDTDLVFGKTVCKQINVRILNSSRLDGLSWTGEFLLQMWVEISSVEYTCDIGYFTGEKPRNVTTARYIDFTAYDRMKRFDVIADEFWNSLTFPKTIKQIYIALCNYVGVTMTYEVPSIPFNRSFAESPANMEGYTCRDILGWIAEETCSYAIIEYDGWCSLKWFDTNNHAITGNEEFRVESADLNPGLTWNQFDELTNAQQEAMTCNDIAGYSEAYAVDQIMVKQVDSDFVINYPSAVGGNVYAIVDNPFIVISSASDVENYVKPLFGRLSAFGGYLPFSMECIGDPAVEAGDIIPVDINGTTLNVPIFVKTMRWNGGITDIYETTGQVPRSAYGTNANKQTVMNSNSIKMFVRNQYYNRKSGIEITDEGVSISGNKFVMVETENSYKWYFNKDGFVLKDNGDTDYDYKFRIGEYTGLIPYKAMASIEMYQNNFTLSDTTYNFFETWFTTTYRRSTNNITYSRRFVIGAGFVYGNELPYFALYSTSNDAILGDTNNNWSRVYTNMICGYQLVNDPTKGRINLVPSDRDMDTRLRIQTDDNYIRMEKAGNSAKSLLYFGGIGGQTTSVTDMNNLTTPGHYWITFSSSIAHKPSSLANNSYCEVIVSKAPDGVSNDIHQMIIKENEIYVRLAWMGTSWGSWYKFSGTQV